MMTSRHWFRWVACVVLGLWNLTAMAEDPRRLAQVAEAGQPIVGAPRASDVCMRSLRPRPVNAQDPHDTLQAMRGFHVTWLEWTYGNDPDFIRRVHSLGATFGGALAAGSYSGDQPHEVWNVRDLEGTPVYATWMRAWRRPNPWGCANHPEFRNGHVRAAIEAVQAGADVLQRDEPGQNMHALNWGGCFCDHCMQGFRAWLDQHADRQTLKDLGVRDLGTFDYREYLRQRDAPVGDDFRRWPGDALKAYFERFQIESTVSFNRWWRTRLNEHFGRPIPVSCNNGCRHWRDIEQVFDYAIGELSASHATPEFLHAAMRQAAALGKTQTVTMPLRRGGPQETADWVRHTRQTLATAYATGGHIEMPWDTYLPTPDAQRYFGDPANYADLTAFVRGMAGFLDGYAEAFACGGDIVDTRWLDNLPPITLLADGVYAWARAVPGESDQPVVIHLVDWRDQPQPFRLSLRPQAFFGSQPLRLRLFTPMLPYDQPTHDRAFESGDYSPLVQETVLAAGYINSVEIPALEPWAMLVVQPESTSVDGIWPPAVIASDAHLLHETTVMLDSATPDTSIHYTRDGTPPSVQSPRYTEPLVLRENTTISAIAVGQGRKSAPVSATFARRERAPNLIPHGDFADGLAGWQRIVGGPAGDDALQVDADPSRRLPGPGNVRLQIRNPTGIVYHLRLVHPFQAEPGIGYSLSFLAVADGPVHCRVGLQARRAPHTVLGMKHEGIGTVPQRYTLRTSSVLEGEAREFLVQFDLGAKENAGRTLWISDVHLEPYGSTLGASR
ncbi:MAG: hypothetical protein EA424_18130 [Planctomycetaceae bacterium]|nr:MAG: hypothetical protein EA424_18130 [Planctomycetaceae bacterium]